MIAPLFVGGWIFVVLLMLCIIPLVLAAFVFWICMIVSAIQNRGLGETEKIVWVLVIVLLHLLGAIIYFFVGRPKRNTPLVV